MAIVPEMTKIINNMEKKNRRLVAEITKKNKTKYVVWLINGSYIILSPVLTLSGNIAFWQQHGREYLTKQGAVAKMKKLAGIKKYGIKVYNYGNKK